MHVHLGQNERIKPSLQAFCGPASYSARVSSARLLSPLSLASRLWHWPVKTPSWSKLEVSVCGSRLFVLSSWHAVWLYMCPGIVIASLYGSLNSIRTLHARYIGLQKVCVERCNNPTMDAELIITSSQPSCWHWDATHTSGRGVLGVYFKWSRNPGRWSCLAVLIWKFRNSWTWFWWV